MTLFFTASAALGCAGRDQPGADAGGDVVIAPDAPDAFVGTDAADARPATDAGPSATLRGQVIYDYLNGSRNVPASNGEIAFGEGPPTTMDALGMYSLAAPIGGRALLRVPLPGELSVQRLVAVPAAGATIDLHVIDIDIYVGSVNRLGGDVDAFDHGAVAVRFVGSRAGGYGATLSAANGGSFVFDGTSTAAVATATTRAAGQTLYFYFVTPGTTRIALSAPAGAADCVDATAPGATEYLVTATTVTEVVLDCP